MKFERQKGGWSFYFIFDNFEKTKSFLEILIFIHIYILTAFLFIREIIFDFLNFRLKNKVQNELKEFLNKSKNVSRKNVALVTGADGTIGSQIVDVLIDQGFEIFAIVQHDRNVWKNKEQVKVFEVDFLKFEETRHVAEEIEKMGKIIDLAVFAAGVMLVPEQYIRGIEAHNFINVVSQALIHKILSKNLKKSIFLSSSTATVACYSSKEDPLCDYCGPYQAYSTSKLNLALYVNQLAVESNSHVVCLHPGTVPGKLYRNANWLVRFLNCTILPLLMRTPKNAALLVLHTVLRSDATPGGYYEDTTPMDLSKRVTHRSQLTIYSSVRDAIN